jgi:23S rRNA pseudouridine2605 synthase
MEKKRLSKFLAAAGVASRRACETIIFAGRVKVNNEVVLTPQTMVDKKDKVCVDNKKIQGEEPHVYYILNKPKNYICSNSRLTGKRIVRDLFPNNSERLFTVGRLDRDTTGLLVVTNDGDFANRIIHPSKNVQKEYLAKVSQEITYEHLTKMSEGVVIEEKLVKPVSVTKVRKGTVKVIVTEGKKHEVRLILQEAGLTVRELCRIRIGSLVLGNLAIGQHRVLTAKERDLL